jgi:hypothetical protein
LALQDQLRELFLLDQQVRGMSSRLDAGTNRLRQQQTRLEQLSRQRHELEDQLKHVQAKAASLEHQANDVDQRIAKLREQMNSVTSNKEYSALLVEVNTIKLDKGKLEDEALAQLAEVDATRARLDELTTKIDDQAKLVTLAENEVAAARDEVGKKLDELKAQRDAAASQVPLDARALFERLSYAHDGQAMAEVEEQDRRRMEYICGGCYMQLPVERVNAVMSRPDQLTTCSNCGRILYMPSELKSAIGSK